MRLGINQPNFLPYLGYIALVKHVDQFILFDTAQFERHGWMERNRVLKQADGGWQYVSVPLEKHSQKTAIRDIRINNSTDWRKRILKQLQLYAKAPYYRDVIGLMQRILCSDYGKLVDLDRVCLEEICTYLGIDTPITVFSEMGLEIGEVKEPDEWALNICKAIPDAGEYWNLPKGRTFFDTKKYEQNGIDLQFMDIEITEYKQLRNDFEGRLSIVDVMMFNDVNEVNRMLDNYKLFGGGYRRNRHKIDKEINRIDVTLTHGMEITTGRKCVG